MHASNMGNYIFKPQSYALVRNRSHPRLSIILVVRMEAVMGLVTVRRDYHLPADHYLLVEILEYCGTVQVEPTQNSFVVQVSLPSLILEFLQ